MIVSRQDLEGRLAELAGQVADPRAGIHGPETMSWQLTREAICFLGGGRAALLQLAHPYVAHGVDQHSRTREDIFGRFQRTFMNVFAMSFGQLDQAVRAARRVHAIHTRVTGAIGEDVGAYRRGHRYHANDAGSLLWVHATLIDTVVQVTELFVRPLGADEKERYYQESRRFAYLFGIPDEVLPADYPAFRAYVDRMCDHELAVGAPARELGRFVLTAPVAAAAPVAAWYRVMTAGLMPARLRAPFGLRFGAGERAVFGASRRALRPLYAAIPRGLRYVPAYVEASRRLSGEEPGPLVGMMERAARRGLEVAMARAG